jgi:hypothetical protein
MCIDMHDHFILIAANNSKQVANEREMPRAGFEPTSLVFERLKIVRALDRAAIGTGCYLL